MTRYVSHQTLGEHRQDGLALVIALIVLVAMTIAGVALVRSTDTAAIIAGNLAFRQSATLAGDSGVEAARGWLLTAGNTLQNDQPTIGYYATSQDSLDLTGNRTPKVKTDDLSWTGATDSKCLAADAAGNTVCYVIHRMCKKDGPLDAATCSSLTADRSGSSKGATRPMSTYQERSWKDATSLGYYRITVRVAGPRNNVSFVQAFVVI